MKLNDTPYEIKGNKCVIKNHAGRDVCLLSMEMAQNTGVRAKYNQRLVTQEPQAQRGRQKGRENSSGSFEKGSERAREAGRKGGKASD